VASVLLCVACNLFETQPESLGHHDFRFPEAALIAHALGHVDGHTYSNSVEALDRSLARGARFLEVDLSLTADGDLVCFHTEMENRLEVEMPITEVGTADFLGRRFDGLFTVMTFESLVRRLNAREDVYLITDCKQELRPCLDEVVEVVRSVDPEFLGRLIPQFYSADQWLDIALIEADHGPFATVILTLYRNDLDPTSVAELASLRSVPVVTMSTERFSHEMLRRLSDGGVDVLTHTVNNPLEIVDFFEQGVRGVYSDWYFTWDEVQAAARRQTEAR
jgi:glycerophosphoryl diester phosphodiesterase